jgi:hypothetical protein
MFKPPDYNWPEDELARFEAYVNSTAPLWEPWSSGAARDVLRLYHNAAAGLDGVFVLTVVDPKTGTARPQQFAVGDVDGMVREAIARGQHENVYFAPAILRKGLAHDQRGKAEDVVAMLGLVIDDDADKRAIPPPGISPAFEITTSTAPAVNRQHHFIFSRSVRPAEAKELAELLHRKCGGDHGTKDIAHVWRLPGTLNHPNEAKLKRGRPPEPQRVELTVGSFTPVDPAELRVVLEAMPDIRPARAARKTAGHAHQHGGGSSDRDEIIARLPGWVTDLIETEIAEGEGDRSAHSFHTMMVLMEHRCTGPRNRPGAREVGGGGEEVGRGSR